MTTMMMRIELRQQQATEDEIAEFLFSISSDRPMKITQDRVCGNWQVKQKITKNDWNL